MSARILHSSVASDVFGGVGIAPSAPPVRTHANRRDVEVHHRDSTVFDKKAPWHDAGSPFTSHPNHRPPREITHGIPVAPDTGTDRSKGSAMRQGTGHIRAQPNSKNSEMQSTVFGGGAAEKGSTQGGRKGPDLGRAARNSKEPRSGTVNQRMSSIVLGGDDRPEWASAEPSSGFKGRPTSAPALRAAPKTSAQQMRSCLDDPAHHDRWESLGGFQPPVKEEKPAPERGRSKFTSGKSDLTDIRQLAKTHVEGPEPRRSKYQQGKSELTLPSRHLASNVQEPSRGRYNNTRRMHSGEARPPWQ